MLGRRPAGQVGSHLADHFQSSIAIHSVNAGQVHSRHPVQVALDIEGRSVLLVVLLAVGSRRLSVAAVLKLLQLGFNLPVALGDLGLVSPVKLQGLGKLEEVLLSPVPLQ